MKLPIVVHLNPADLAELLDILAPVCRVQIHHGVGTEGRENPGRPSRFTNSAMMLQRVGRCVGRGQNRNIEPVEQTARAELGKFKPGSDVIINLLS